MVTVCAGCLRSLWVNHKRVDFVNAARTQRTAAGCGEDEPPAPPLSSALQEDGGHYQVTPSRPVTGQPDHNTP